MSRLSITALSAGALWLTACSARMPEIPVSAPPGELSALAGYWTGTYEMTTGARRTGTITFELEAGRDTAHGVVVMSYDTWDTAGLPPGHSQHQSRLRSEPIPVSFVRLTHGRISGMLAPYNDPVCGCRLKTTFTGWLHGSTVEGTFVTLHLESAATDSGTWNALRLPRAISE